MPLLLRLLLSLCLGLAAATSSADVVKPALIEISAYTDGRIEIEMRVSIEALLTGINSRYKNTQDAPAPLAAAYDTLRVMQPQALRAAFSAFEHELVQALWLQADGNKVSLQIAKVHIPEVGYSKVPRISVLQLTGTLTRSATQLQWYYPERFGDNAVRVRQVDTANEQWHWSEWQWLRNDAPSSGFSLAELFTRKPVYEVVLDYTVLGFEHIMPKGLDHMLFILGIFLLSTRLQALLWQVTMFTLAHTITLGLSMHGIISLPANVVEPLIALSITYIGIENVCARALHKSRLLLVFGFGLLHGLGFAGVLGDFGMPRDAFATALISFNVGVEFGQLAVLALAFGAFGFWFRNKFWYRARIIVPGSLLIALVGLYWTLERLELF